QFGFTVNSSSTEEDWLYGYLGDSSWSPSLVDSQNLRKHSVLKKSINRAQTAVQGPEFTPGETYYAFAVFAAPPPDVDEVEVSDRKSTRLNSSHVSISYAVFCLKKKKEKRVPQ